MWSLDWTLDAGATPVLVLPLIIRTIQGHSLLGICDVGIGRHETTDQCQAVGKCWHGAKSLHSESILESGIWAQSKDMKKRRGREKIVVDSWRRRPGAPVPRHDEPIPVV